MFRVDPGRRLRFRLQLDALQPRFHAVQLGAHFGRPSGGDAVFANRDVGFHARLLLPAEHFDHLPDRVLMPGRVADDARRHDVAVGGRALAAARNGDVAGEARVVRLDETDAAFHVEMPDDFALRVDYDLDHRALPAAARVDVFQARQHAVAVQHLAHLTVVQEQVAAAVVRDDEAVTVGVADHPPGDERHLARQRVAPLAVLQHQAAVAHARQTPGQRIRGGAAFDVKMRADFGRRHRALAVGEEVQQQHPARRRHPRPAPGPPPARRVFGHWFAAGGRPRVASSVIGSPVAAARLRRATDSGVRRIGTNRKLMAQGRATNNRIDGGL